MTQQPLTNSEIQDLAYQIVRNLQGNHGFPLIKYNGEIQEVLPTEDVTAVIANAISEYILIPKYKTHE